WDRLLRTPSRRRSAARRWWRTERREDPGRGAAVYACAASDLVHPIAGSTAAPLSATLDVREAAARYLDALAKASRETISLSVWAGTAAVVIQQVVGAV